MIPWPLKGAFVAWGLSAGQWSPYELAQRAQGAGLHWLALEYDDFSNAIRWAPFRDECRRFRILPGIWTTVGGNVGVAPSDAGFVIAEVEGPADYESLMNIDINGFAVPHAIVTNFSTLTPERSAPLIAAGWECLTECYLGDNPLARPDRMDAEARIRGWPRSLPVFGIWNEPYAAYDEWRGDPHALYLAEHLL